MNSWVPTVILAHETNKESSLLLTLLPLRAVPTPERVGWSSLQVRAEEQVQWLSSLALELLAIRGLSKHRVRTMVYRQEHDLHRHRHAFLLSVSLEISKKRKIAGGVVQVRTVNLPSTPSMLFHASTAVRQVRREGERERERHQRFRADNRM